MIGLIVLAVFAGVAVSFGLFVTGASFWLILAAYSGTGAIVILSTIAFRGITDALDDFRTKDEIAMLKEHPAHGSRL